MLLYEILARPTLKTNKFKISTRMWNKKFELPDGSYSVLDIQDYFDHFIKNHQTVTDNAPIKIYVNKMKKKKDYFQNLKRVLSQTLTPETIKLLESTKSKITKDENGENVLRHCNIANNGYKQNSGVL